MHFHYGIYTYRNVLQSEQNILTLRPSNYRYLKCLCCVINESITHIISLWFDYFVMESYVE